MKRFLLISILGGVQVLNTTFAQGTPWKLPVFTNITDLAEKGSPLAFDKVVLVTDMGGSSWYFATNTVFGSNTTTRIASVLVPTYSWQLVATAGGTPGGGNVFSTGTPAVGAIPSYVGGNDTNVVPSSVTIGSTTNGSGLNMRDTGMGYFGLRAPDTVITNVMLIGFVYPPPDGSLLGVVVDGTNVYLTNMTALGDTIWTNSVGTIQAIHPIANEVDGTVVFNLDTSLVHTSGNILQVGNDATNKVFVEYDGTIDFTGNLNGNSGGSSTLFYNHANGKMALLRPTGSVEPQLDLTDTDTSNVLQISTDLFLGTKADGVTTFNFQTANAHTTGDIFSIANITTNKFIVSSTGQIRLAGTTNQVTFGSTNSAPVSSSAPTKWISVQVQGDSGVYRLPLYE